MFYFTKLMQRQTVECSDAYISYDFSHVYFGYKRHTWMIPYFDSRKFHKYYVQSRGFEVI